MEGGTFVAEQYTTEDIALLCRRFPGVDIYYPFCLQPECFRVAAKSSPKYTPMVSRGALTILLGDPDIPR